MQIFSIMIKLLFQQTKQLVIMPDEDSVVTSHWSTVFPLLQTLKHTLLSNSFFFGGGVGVGGGGNSIGQLLKDK